MESCLPDLEISSFRITEEASVIGKTIGETELRKRYGVTLLVVNRNYTIISNPAADFVVAAGDVLFLVGEAGKIQAVKEAFNSR
jgi:CPA2 family monovalent cation:H+ antiporter-2